MFPLIVLKTLFQIRPLSKVKLRVNKGCLSNVWVTKHISIAIVTVYMMFSLQFVP